MPVSTTHLKNYRNRVLARLALLMALFGLTGLALANNLPNFTELAKQTGPAVVNISTQKTLARRAVPHNFQMPDLPEDSPFNELFKHFFQMPKGLEKEGGKSERSSLGSGFIISEDGYIVTNHHVVEGADEIIIRLTDRREFEAKVIGSDQRSDVALLKIEAAGLPTLKTAQTDEVQVGEWVLAIGSPFGFDHSVTAGIVSAKGRSLPDDTYVPFIQTDVAINPGNSGGPLINLKGEVIGVNSQIYSRTGGYMGLAFSIPIDVAMDVVEQLRDKGKVTRGWLGVYIQDVTRELAESFGLDSPRGALVAQVIEDSPAAKAGIQVGDVILEYNGKQVDSSSVLPHLVGRSLVDEDAKLSLLRKGEQLELSVRIGELSGDGKQADGRVDDSDRLGLGVRDLTAAERDQLEIKKELGVLVTRIESGPASRAGVMVDDVILMLDNQAIKSASQFAKLVTELPAEKSIAVLVQRKSGTLFLAMRLPKK
ncbi:MAG: DegQ family serine endoprotease [Gammaproteobacteria bacterium SHHR-1]|uniref:DegQ family serine endoprotease n=1 Tax=Magnetovirga frankeli TaxID=947516 RepID=UPI0012930E6E|nr:DegQ family serine endoprotease [gamma proteobacterium SS-5]